MHTHAHKNAYIKKGRQTKTSLNIGYSEEEENTRVEEIGLEVRLVSTAPYFVVLILELCKCLFIII